METLNDTAIDRRIAQRLKALRSERGWSLDELAKHSGVSRASLSRLENAEVSATANILGKLCAAYGMAMSRLVRMAEEDFTPLISRNAQWIWKDPEIGFRRRSISPPAQTLAGEVLECELDAATHIAYDHAPKPGLEHHLLLIEGQLHITIGNYSYHLNPGDCLRYRLFGSSAFRTPENSGARYIIFMI